MEPTNFERLISKRVALGAVRDSVAVVCIERHGATAEQKPAPRSSPPHPRLLPYGVPSRNTLRGAGSVILPASSRTSASAR